MSRHGGREGQIFGSYRLLRFLGQGGFGEVYLAEHIYLQTPVAVKLLNREEDQRIRDHIRAEARTSAQLDHPHIVRVLDFGFEGDIPYLVMSYAPHGTLRALHPRGTMLSPERIAFYVRPIAQALQYAHDHKIVHRDVKPENLLLDANNQVLLSDFGIAVAAHRTHSLSPQDAIGTVAYMAPEQTEGKARPASDQYSLAICVYEWLSGYLPFTGTSTIEIALKHQREQPPPLNKSNPWLYQMAPSLQKVLMKALAKEPRKRFENVSMFAEALLDACNETRYRGSTIISYGGHVKSVLTLAWSPNGQWIASGGSDGTVQVWEAKTGKPVQTYLGHKAEVNTLCWSPDGTHLVSGSEDRTVHVWHALTGKHLLTYQGHTHAVDAVAWSPDGTRIASGSTDRTVQIWNATNGILYVTYQGHAMINPTSYIMNTLAWSPSGFYLASGSEDRTAQVWDAATGKQLQCFGDRSPIITVAWLNQEMALLIADNKTVQIADPLTGTITLTYTPPARPNKMNNFPWCAAPSPDSRYIASGDSDRVIRIWRADTGERLFSYRGHHDHLKTIAWSPDGTRIASAAGREVYVWQAMGKDVE